MMHHTIYPSLDLYTGYVELMMHHTIYPSLDSLQDM